MLDSARWLRSRTLPVLVATLVISLALGCRAFVPANVRLDQVDPARGGYRPGSTGVGREAGKVWIFLAFSGGGTRAAAFSYGVMEGLRDTEIEIDGKRRRLLDEVDAISGVSGGSFPAAYYGLFGDRIFEDFAPRFLNKNIQRGLLLKTLNPWNLLRLMTPYLSRSDLASRYYSDNLFDNATFADLTAAKGVRVHINATDLSLGTPFRFNQDTFDVICSDLDVFPISTAVAASSAVPVLLSPITLRNYTGTCGFEPPEWFEEALKSRRSNPRGYQAAKNALPFFNPDKRYIHLIDGGVSDNLGLRMPLDRVAAIGSAEKLRELEGIARPEHLLFIVVNAETEPDPAIDLQAAAPSLAASMNLVSGAQIRRYNFETLILARESIQQFGRDLSKSGRPVSSHFVEVSFDLIDEDDRPYFKRLPTSFKLSEEQVERLRQAGRELLAESDRFQDFLEGLR